MAVDLSFHNHLDQTSFDNLIESQTIPESISSPRFNYCAKCNIPMKLSCDDYICESCGVISHGIGDVNKDNSSTASGSVRIGSGKYYSVSSDYSKTQLKTILHQLLQRQLSYTGLVFPQNVLLAAAMQYNTIQKHITEDSPGGKKKFVRRGNIKDEILAGLIYFEGIREKIVRKKKDIAIFMNLASHGFSRGEDILRNLNAKGLIQIPVDDEPIEGYIDRYLDALCIDEKWSPFIAEIVNLSEDRKIGMNSQISSKVVGVIWLVINRCKLKITSDQLEKAADGTKRNTFMKFYNVVVASVCIFGPIFDKYGISRV